MKESLKKINIPILLLCIYLIKVLIIPQILFNDVLVLLVFVIMYIAKIVEKIYNQYYATKLSVISENEFRQKVMDDMFEMKTELNSFKLLKNGLGKFKTGL